MRSNRKILFGVLILVAVFILYGLYSALSRNSGPTVATTATPTGPVREASYSPGNGKIYVAATDIPPHSIVTREMLKLKDQDGSTEGFITDPNTQAVGFITRVRIPYNSSIRPEEDFVGHISQVGIAGALNPGRRAMVIPIGNKPTLHDLVRIGNYVDVLASFDGQEARTIVQGVRVLAVDVSGNDFPDKSVAMRGPFKTDAQGRDVTGAAVAPGRAPAPADPNATPTATPEPTPVPANQARPDPALTIEVTPAQAAAIQLAQASNASLDYLLLPSLPGNRTTDQTSDSPDEGAGTGAIGGTTGASTPNLIPVSVTKAQIAPYAERKKNANNGGGGNSGSSRSGGSGSSGESGRRTIRTSFDSPPLPRIGSSIPPVNPSGPEFVSPPTTTIVPPQPTAAPTYNIPIYADGKVVRTETVLTPQE